MTRADLEDPLTSEVMAWGRTGDACREQASGSTAAMMVDGFPSAAVNIQVAEAPVLPAPCSASETKYFQRGFGSPNGSKSVAPLLSNAEAVPQTTYLRAIFLLGGSNTSLAALGEIEDEDPVVTMARAKPEPALASRKSDAMVKLIVGVAEASEIASSSSAP